jgi:hypothetical protein
MSCSFSFKLLPGEQIIEDSSKDQGALIKPVCSVLLTNKRVIFRFDGLGGLLKKSLSYDEIRNAKSVKRIGINYLQIETNGREHLFNTADPEIWSKRIMAVKENQTSS